MAVTPIPEGVSPITPYLSVKNAAEAIEFYKQVFEASDAPEDA
jgi:PhnB protein